MAQQIEQLKASVEQFEAGQEQMSRDIARASESEGVRGQAFGTEPAPTDRRAEDGSATAAGRPQG